MWLLEQSVARRMEQAVTAGLQPTAEQQTQFEARAFGAEENGPRLLAVAGNQAEINITGVITQRPDFLAMLFGGGNTTYVDIITAFEAAEQDDDVEKITMRVDSPGGQFGGLFEALAAIEATTKPVEAIASKAASAAFALVSKADTITAVNQASMFGSIGVVLIGRVDESTVEVTSTAAPKKRPDLTTEAGKAVAREEADALHTIFAEAIAGGRSTTVEKVNADFGQGATLLAEDALKRGMIDGIADSPLNVVPKPAAASRKTKAMEASIMDLVTLKAQHHDVYAAAVQEGIGQGTTQERDRVSAHLTMGEASGDMVTACASIKDGSEMTATLSATYMAAGMNRGDTETRTAEEIATAEALAAAEAGEIPTGAAAEAETVANALGGLLGVGEV